MEIFISIDGVLRNTIQKFDYNYNDAYLSGDLPEDNTFEYGVTEPIQNDNLLNSYKFQSKEEFEFFLFVEYPIEILFCKTCNTAHQRFQVPKEDLFPSNYHYRSRFTADVLTGMKDLVSSCKQRLGDLKGKKVLDIGCNDGSLLDEFKNFVRNGTFNYS